MIQHNFVSHIVTAFCFVTVTLGFFEDIIIPPHKLQHPSRFDQMDQVWVWEYKTGDGETHDLFMDAGMSPTRAQD